MAKKTVKAWALVWPAPDSWHVCRLKKNAEHLANTIINVQKRPNVVPVSIVFDLPDLPKKRAKR